MKIYRIASMTLHVAGADSPPEDLLSLTMRATWKINEMINAKFGSYDFAVTDRDFTPDGGDEFETEGVANLYLSKIPEEAREDVISMAEKALMDSGSVETVNLVNYDTWGDYFEKGMEKYDEDLSVHYPEHDPSSNRVARISIKMKDIGEVPPSVNMSNHNAHYIFQSILGYEGNLWDLPALDPNEVLQRAKYFLGESSYETPERDFDADQKVNDMFKGEGFKDENMSLLTGDPSMTNYQDPEVRMRLGQIVEVCEWAISKGFKELYLN